MLAAAACSPTILAQPSRNRQLSSSNTKMTEYWKSNAMYWCDLCKCWMNDTKAAKLNHERGAKHQENLEKKLREMAKKADAERKMEKQAAATMDAIEEAAQKQYQADQEAQAAISGRWTWDEGSGYYYNAVHRWYYDPKTQWYYGGNPVEWTQKPTMPSAAMFGTAPHSGGPVPVSSSSAGAAVGASRPGPAAAGSGGSSKAALGAAAEVLMVKKRVITPQAHPLAQVGGHAMPVAGKIGGAKGIGLADDPKRKRPDGAAGAAAAAAASKKPLTPEEEAFIARREAARQRVQKRTMDGFGLT